MSRMTTQAFFILTTILASWLGMQQVHEIGHLGAAYWIGAAIDHVALHSFTISHTDVGPNRHPLVVVWAGPIAGVAVTVALGASAYAVYRVQSVIQGMKENFETSTSLYQPSDDSYLNVGGAPQE
jgi:hypothetical protein